MRALRIKDVAAKVGLGQSTIYRMMAEGRFPKSFEIAPKRSAWLELDIDTWLAERAGRPELAPAIRDAEAIKQQMQFA
ncbi:prophage regulatory protein [Burkholderia multivorans]